MKAGRILKNSAKAAAAVILMLVLLHKVEAEDLKKAAGAVGAGHLCLSIVIYLASVGLNAVKWKILLPGVPVSRLGRTCLKAQFYSMVLPGQLFGEAAKIADLKGSSRQNAEAASSVIMDKITALAGTMAVGAAGAAYTAIEVPRALRLAFIIMLPVLMVPALSARLPPVRRAVACASCRLWKSPNLKAKKSGIGLYRLYGIWEAYAQNGGALLLSVFLGGANQMLGALQAWVVSESMELGIGYAEYCWIMPAVSVLLLLPVSFGGLGVREVSLGGFLALFGAAPEEAVVISAVLLLSQSAAAAAGAAAAIYDHAVSARQKKRQDNGF